MSGHELARLLLTLPDDEVVLYSDSDWSALIQGAYSTTMHSPAGQVCLTWVPD